MTTTSYQPRIKTEQERDAMAEWSAMLGAHNDAEGLRHAIRVLAALIVMSDSSALIWADEAGEDLGQAVLPEPPGAVAESREPLLPKKEQRRWTVQLTATDRARCETIRKYLGGKEDESMATVCATAITWAGEYAEHVSKGHGVWAEKSAGWGLVAL